jgi:uncharacterized membrane protein
MDTGHTPDDCAACRALRAATESERSTRDAPLIGHEAHIVAGLKREQDRVADKITGFAGSMKFVYLHGLWFAVWIVLNVGMLGASLVFDKFPFGLLTMIVSLEAIFLSTFVMISQNRQAARADIRSDLDFENNVRSEIWAMHVGHKLGVDSEHVESAIQSALSTYRQEKTI